MVGGSREVGMDGFGGALAVLDGLDREVAPTGSAVAPGPDAGEAGAAGGVGSDAAGVEGDAGADSLETRAAPGWLRA
jgi:hypothetical protein